MQGKGVTVAANNSLGVLAPSLRSSYLLFSCDHHPAPPSQAACESPFLEGKVSCCTAALCVLLLPRSLMDVTLLQPHLPGLNDNQREYALRSAIQVGGGGALCCLVARNHLIPPLTALLVLGWPLCSALPYYHPPPRPCALLCSAAGCCHSGTGAGRAAVHRHHHLSPGEAIHPVCVHWAAVHRPD